MKRLILSLFLVISCISAHAATWYVRTDGGTATQCTGHTNAAYSGSGKAQACAYNHPFYLATDNTSTAAFAWKIAAGDTIQFADQGPYYIGEGPVNGLGTVWLGCTSGPVECVLPQDIPSTAANPTHILGFNAGSSCHNTGHNALVKPTQLVGINGVYWMLSLEGSQSLDVECLDFTQPDTCTPWGSGTMRVDNSSLASGTATYLYTLINGVSPGVTEFINISGTKNGGGVLNLTNKQVAKIGGSTYKITSSQSTGSDVTIGYTVLTGEAPAVTDGQMVYVQGTTNPIPGLNNAYTVTSSTGGSTGTYHVTIAGAGTHSLQSENGTGINSNSGTVTVTGMGTGTVAAAADTGSLDPFGKCVQGTNNFAQTGINFAEGANQGPSNLTLKDISIHGLASRGIKGSHINSTPSDTTNISDIYLFGNGMTGFDSDSGYGGTNNESKGTINISHMNAQWNGCVEVKPNGGTIGGNGVNYCVDQAYFGNGDGIVMVATAGTWNWSDIITKWNTQDGFDALHMTDDPTSNPVVKADRMYSEGNEGASIKIGGSTTTLTSSIGISNCSVLGTASNFPGNPAGWNARLGSLCRAADGMAFQMTGSNHLTIQHVTNITEFSTAWDFEPAAGVDCGADCVLTFQNNITMGFPVPGDGRFPGNWYMSLKDPSANPGSVISNNDWFNLRGSPICPAESVETGSICTDPKFVAESKINAFNPALTATSPAIGAGVAISGVTTDNAGNAYATRPSIGALEFGAAAPSITPSTLTLVATPTVSTALQPVTLTASAATVGGVVPTGSVTFSIAGTSLGSAPLNSAGVAGYTLSSLVAGSYAVTATYVGDANYSSATSSSVSLSVSSPTPPPTSNPQSTTPPPTTSPPSNQVSIAVGQPTYGFQVIPNSTRRIFATVTNGTTDQVVWTVKSGSAQISSNSGSWVDVTAPATGSSCSITGTSANYKVTSATQFTIEAASVDDGSKIADVIFNVCKPTVEVSIVPFYRTLYANQPADVQSLILGSVNQNVHWAITSQPTGGDGKLTDSTSRDTLFTGTVPGRYHLTATSVADSRQSATAIMYVTGHNMPYRVTPNQTEPVDCTVDPSMLGTVYEVGPSQTFKTLASVPFPTMAPGSTVRLHNEDSTGLHPTEYHEYVQLSQPATADQPFRICGVPDTAGNLPIIDGSKATGRVDTTATGGYGLLSLHNSNYFSYWPKFSAAEYIAVEGIQFRNAKTGNTYQTPTGSTGAWQDSSACIHIDQAQNVTFVGDDIGSCSNGALSEFNSNGGWGDSDVNLLWEGNHIHNNGINGSKAGYQMYLQSWGNVVQFNRIDNYTAGALGANIKSRGLQDIFRYNYLGDGAQREMDLVDVKDAPAYMSFDGFLSGGTNAFHSLYSKDTYSADRIAAEQEAWNSHFVYGNIYQNSTSTAPIHFSMDISGAELARKGSLYWYNNTFYEKACSTCSGQLWTLFDTSGGSGAYYPQTEFQTVQAYNNVVWLDDSTKPIFQWNNYSAFIGIGGGNLLPSNWGSDAATGGAGSGWNTDPNTAAYQNSLPLNTHVTGLDKGDLMTTGSIPFDRNSWILTSKIVGVQNLPSAVCEMPARFAYLPNLGYAVPRAIVPNVGATDTVAETATLMNQVAGSGRYNNHYSSCH